MLASLYICDACLFGCFVRLSLFAFACLFVCLFVRFVFTCLFFLSVCLFVCLSVCLHACLFACLFVVCLIACVCLFVRLRIPSFVYLFVFDILSCLRQVQENLQLTKMPEPETCAMGVLQKHTTNKIATTTVDSNNKNEDSKPTATITNDSSKHFMIQALASIRPQITPQ